MIPFGPVLRDDRLWLGVSGALVAACAATRYLATRTSLPAGACGRGEAWSAASSHFNTLTNAAQAVGFTGLAVAVAGIAVARTRERLLLAVLVYLVVVLLAGGHDFLGDRCGI
jgi:ABC-type Na+ efflux pump permease subunit